MFVQTIFTTYFSLFKCMYGLDVGILLSVSRERGDYGTSNMAFTGSEVDFHFSWKFRINTHSGCLLDLWSSDSISSSFRRGYRHRHCVFSFTIHVLQTPTLRISRTLWSWSHRPLQSTEFIRMQLSAPAELCCRALKQCVGRLWLLHKGLHCYFSWKYLNMQVMRWWYYSSCFHHMLVL